MQWKSPVVGRLFFLLALSALGCGDGGAPVEGPPQPYKGVGLWVACPAGAPADVVALYSRGWASRNGVAVEVRPCEAGRNPATTVEGADVWVLPPAELPHWAAQGKLQPLPPEYQSADNPYQWYRLLPLYREKLLVWDRKVYGLPLLGESPLCCYRADLLADEKHKTQFAKQSGKPLAPPATWEDFAALAGYFHGAGLGPSLPPLPEDDGDLGREFFAVAASCDRRAIPLEQAGKDDRGEEEFAFHYDLGTGRPRIDKPAFVYALQLLQRLQKFRGDGAAASPAQAFRDGRAVLCLTDATQLREFQAAPALRDKFGVCRLPGGGFYFDPATGDRRATPDDNRVPYLGSSGWLAVVPTRSAHPEAAFALLAELSGTRVSAQIVQEPRWGGGATRDEHFRTARWDAFDLDAARTTALKEALRDTVQYQIRNPVLCLRTPDEAPHRAALAVALRAALAKPDADAAETLAGVARRWEELDKARGEREHLSEYRISLGLLPR
jgi:ABC-type glycerol-3-phosphate transport system substrate-binding protein